MEKNSSLEVGNVVGHDQLRVLAIDAQVFSLQSLCIVLNECNYKIKTATLTAEALDLLKANKDEFDIVLVDVDGLNMDGFKLMEIVGLEMYLPVIMVTIDGSLYNISKGLLHGAVDYILKPVGMHQIKTSIWHFVGQNRTDGSAQYTYTHSDNDYKPEIRLGYASCGFGKKRRLKWTPELDAKFINAVQQLSKDSVRVHPKQLLKIMNEPGLTRANVASHLQKYRNSKKGKAVSSSCKIVTSKPRKRGANSGSACLHDKDSNHGITAAAPVDTYSNGYLDSEPDTTYQPSDVVALEVPNLSPDSAGLMKNISETDLVSSGVENSYNDLISHDVDVDVTPDQLKQLEDEDLSYLWEILNSD